MPRERRPAGARVVAWQAVAACVTTSRRPDLIHSESGLTLVLFSGGSMAMMKYVAAWIVVMMAACGGSDSVSEAPLPLAASNAPGVAAEVLVSTGGIGDTSSAPSGSIAAIRRAAPGLARRHALGAAAPRLADDPPEVESCEVSGTTTTTSSMTATT